MRIVKKRSGLGTEKFRKETGLRKMNGEKNILVSGASGTAENPDADRKTGEIRKTVIGTVKICSDLPYPCVPAPEVKEENGEIRRIVTASHRFRLHGVPQNRKSPRFAEP